MVSIDRETDAHELCAHVSYNLQIKDPDILQYMKLYTSRDGSQLSDIGLGDRELILAARDTSAKLVFMPFLITEKMHQTRNPYVKNLVYWQVQHNILVGKLRVNEDILLKLAALKFHQNFGNPSSVNHREGFIGAGRICEFIPSHLLNQHTPSIWESLIQKAHRELSLEERGNPVAKYLSAAKLAKQYASSFWQATQNILPGVPKNILLAIGGNAIDILDLETRRTFDSFSHQEIVKWGFSKDKFWFFIKPTNQNLGSGPLSENFKYEFCANNSTSISKFLTDVLHCLKDTLTRRNIVLQNSKLKNAATVIQTSWRAYIARLSLDKLIEAITLRLTLACQENMPLIPNGAPPKKPKSTFLVGIL